MKKVIIGMKDGKPYVKHAPRKIDIVFEEEKPKKKTFRKRFRTAWYHIKTRWFRFFEASPKA